MAGGNECARACSSVWLGNTGSSRATPPTPSLFPRRSFAGGSFRDRVRRGEAARAGLADQITVQQSQASQSHTAGFEAWLRSRGQAGVRVYTSEDVVDEFGVVKGAPVYFAF